MKTLIAMTGAVFIPMQPMIMANTQRLKNNHTSKCYCFRMNSVIAYACRQTENANTMENAFLNILLTNCISLSNIFYNTINIHIHYIHIHILQNGMNLIRHVTHENLLLTLGCKTHTHTHTHTHTCACTQSQ